MGFEEEQYEQLSLFDSVENYTIPKNKKLYLTELFAGIGAQSKSLEILGVPFEHRELAEWSIHSIRAYARIHNLIDTNKIEELTQGKTKEEMLKRIRGVSRDYNQPMTNKQLSSLKLDEIKDIYACCLVENNFINIMEMKGTDLGVYKENEYNIWTYSFPCQDLSLSGKLGGLSVSQSKGEEGTRSGLLWEVERLLCERERERVGLPNLLLLENVEMLVSQLFIDDFHKWCKFLESLGYTNQWQILNAKDYGLPQNRKRIFMVSILDQDKPFTFPKKIKLKHKLNYFLDDNVDKKYFISKKMLLGMLATDFNSYKLENRVQDMGGVADTLTTRTGQGVPHLVQVDFPKKLTGGGIPIKEATKKGFAIAQVGDGIDMSGRMQYHRGNVQKGLSQTLTTQCNVGILVDETNKKD